MLSTLINMAGMFTASTNLVNKGLSEVDPDKWFVQPSPDSNHLMWVVGHLVASRGQALRVLGPVWDTPKETLFGRGAKIVHRDEYPSPDEMTSAWADVSTKLAAAIDSATDEVLAGPYPAEFPVLSFESNVRGALSLCAYHEAYHVGQIAHLRKWLGYGQLVG